MNFMKNLCLVILIIIFSNCLFAQGGIQWFKDGASYSRIEEGQIVKYVLPSNSKTVIVAKDKLIPKGQANALQLRSFQFSEDGRKVLLFTNTKKVWRYHTRGDYWILDLSTNSLHQVGKGRPSSSLMFAKFSPDGRKVAYVSEYNLFYEQSDQSSQPKQLTFDGNRKFINGTFDWAYEEEFFCRDGFRWSPDSRKIAFWQIDARKTKDYLMINHTDSIYPFVVPVEYPIAGEPPSPFRIGVIDLSNVKTKWMNIPTDPVLGSYVPRMEWAPNSNELIIQHLNRRQNTSDVMFCNISTGAAKSVFHETDSAWIDIVALWDFDYQYGGWEWLNKGKEFIWPSERDGWRHIYRISREGKPTLITNGKYDVIEIAAIDERSGFIYFFASPENATQKYLYRTRLDGTGTAERLSPAHQVGTHSYNVSPTGQFAMHSFTNHYVRPVNEWISLPDHKGLNGDNKVNDAIATADKKSSSVEFLKIKTSDGVEMDAWMVKPLAFDQTKKYPVVFFVYTEPWGQEVKDQFGIANNFLYQGDMAKDGYIYISIDNRGTPVPKGRAWRKSIHRKIGVLNIRDQAMAAKEVMKWPYVDTSRIAVWGWSGGGNATLGLMFQYPEIYKTGIAIAAVGNQLTYDNIYQERYMGIPQETRADFVAGSPITYAKNLRGNLLYIHGTGDDNVHYNNAEMLLNELIKHNRQFQFMAYPNRTHGISEGAGTFAHLSTLYTNYLRQHCPPGAK